jgi:hypothetical protein
MSFRAALIAVFSGVAGGNLHSHSRPTNTVHSDQRNLSHQSLVPPWGDEACPCLKPDEIIALNITDIPDRIRMELGEQTDLDKYGIGCEAHDTDTTICTQQCNSSDSILLNCDKSWCDQKWCYVNKNLEACKLSHFWSLYFPLAERAASYATCWEMDIFSRSYKTLKNRTLKVGFNSNTGGWSGAFNANNEQFLGPLSDWSGPLVKFVKEAAARGDFAIELMQPNEKLRLKSSSFFNSNSSFDLCVYAVTLGMLDMCVAQYTINEERSSLADFMVLGADDLYLVIEKDLSAYSSLEVFRENLVTIFVPFTFSCWAFIFLLAVPLFGLLMWFHEYGKPNSAYPKRHFILVSVGEGGEQLVEEAPVPWYENYVRAVYASWLALLQQNWEHGVVSIGAKLNLLGMSFFMLTLISVCK